MLNGARTTLNGHGLVVGDDDDAVEDDEGANDGGDRDAGRVGDVGDHAHNDDDVNGVDGDARRPTKSCPSWYTQLFVWWAQRNVRTIKYAI